MQVLRFAGGASPEKGAIERAIRQYVANINRGDVKAIVAACARHTSVVDGSPPYAWQTCRDWWRSYVSNNRSVGATLGVLAIGKVVYWEVAHDHAYFIYPATFTDTQGGKFVVYNGIGTMTLKLTRLGWLFTGSAWAWGANTLLARGGTGKRGQGGFNSSNAACGLRPPTGPRRADPDVRTIAVK